MLFYIVAYDIPCDKRRRKVANLLGSGFNIRCLSVCWLNQNILSYRNA